jgi:hypothetical protein
MNSPKDKLRQGFLFIKLLLVKAQSIAAYDINYIRAKRGMGSSQISMHSLAVLAIIAATLMEVTFKVLKVPLNPHPDA